MTAAEWLTQRFGSGDEFCPMPTYSASRRFFVDTFGPTLQQALAEGKRGQALYDALMATPGGTRGWELYFRSWLERGLLD